MSNRIIPYFNIYASDFKAFKDKLTPQEFYNLLDGISDICLFGFTDFKPITQYQKILFKKIQENLQKSSKSYNASVENGRKGGRPRKNPQVISRLENEKPKTNLDETNKKEKKRKEKNKKEEKKINKKEYGEFKNIILSDEEHQKLSELYKNKLNEAFEVLSVWKKNKNKKNTHNYGSLLKSQWVYKKVFEKINKNPYKPLTEKEKILKKYGDSN